MKRFRTGNKVDITFNSERYEPVVGAEMVDDDHLGVTVVAPATGDHPHERVVFYPWSAVQSLSRDMTERDEWAPGHEPGKPDRRAGAGE